MIMESDMEPIKSPNFPKPVDPTYGVWIVSTDADCEGRSAKRLGIYEGHIDEIALYLADKAMYNLFFSRFETVVNKPGEPTGAVVAVSLDFYENDNIESIDSLFSDRPVSIIPSTIFNSFEIVGDQDAIKRKIALSKLTEEERKMLGL